MECKECLGEGGITVDNFGDVQSFQCPICKGTGMVEDDPYAEFNEINKESFKIWNDFWSDDECLKNVVHQFGVEALKDDVLFYIKAVEHFKNRMDTAERQRDETVKALEWYGDTDNHKWSHTYDETGEVEGIPSKVAWDRGYTARTTIKHIKGE